MLLCICQLWIMVQLQVIIIPASLLLLIAFASYITVSGLPGLNYSLSKVYIIYSQPVHNRDVINAHIMILKDSEDLLDKR